MDNKLYIKKFIRDDGEQLEFDGVELYLAEENTLLVRPDPNTTSINYTEADGGEMIHQQNVIYDQTINGLIVPKTTGYWELSSKLSKFFQINHTYKIIYKKINGDLFAVSGAWISQGLQIKPVSKEDYSKWDIQFSIGNVHWTEYAENSEGEQIYSNTIILPLISAAIGGEVWDNVGGVWDDTGEEWEAGAGGVQVISVNSTSTVYPVWTVIGPCMNPRLQNNTTDTNAWFDGTVATGQTLVVDFETGVAHLDSELVTRYINGLVSLAPGNNTVGFDSDGGTTETSTLSWDNIIN